VPVTEDAFLMMTELLVWCSGEFSYCYL